MDAKRAILAGIDLLERGRPRAALECFEAAATLRQAGDWQENPQAAWELAAAHLNRGDVLVELAENEAAIPAYEQAIRAMDRVPLAENPHCAGRLILAWIRRAGACGEIGRTEESLAGFSIAEDLLATSNALPDGKILSSMLHANRARLLLRTGRAPDGWREARRAVHLTGDPKRCGDANVAAAIRARAILCHALAVLLDEPGGAALPADWIAEATDCAEEALALVRASPRREPWMADLVRYGAKIYRTCQPRFLAEFLVEWLATDGPFAGDAELIGEMRAELRLAIADLELRVRSQPHDTERVERETAILTSLQQAGKELTKDSPSEFYAIVTSPSQSIL